VCKLRESFGRRMRAELCTGHEELVAAAAGN
jgi:hypothetical protein